MNADLTKIPSELVRSVVSDMIEKQLNTKNYQLTVSPATKPTDLNFTGIIYRVTFSAENKEKTSRSTSIILKVAPQHLARRTQFIVRPLFIREIFVFAKIFPAFGEFERSKGVIDDGFIEYPVCYKTVDVDINECLLLEDLALRGFSTIDRKTGVMTAEHVYLVMQSLAKFHAISFAMKDQQPERFNELISTLDENVILKSNIQFRHYLTEQSKVVFGAVSEERELLVKLRKLYEREALDIAADCIDVESIGAATVITYGDAHQNNILFRNDGSGTPTETIFVDWQVARHASPVNDIAYFVFCSTTKEVRDDHYESFLTCYHETLFAHIRRLGSDPQKLFPYDLMREHLRKYAKFGFIMSSVQIPVLTMENDYIPDFEAIAENVEKGTLIDKSTIVTANSLNKMNKRFRDIVADMVRLNYI